MEYLKRLVFFVGLLLRGVLQQNGVQLWPHLKHFQGVQLGSEVGLFCQEIFQMLRKVLVCNLMMFLDDLKNLVLQIQKPLGKSNFQAQQVLEMKRMSYLMLVQENKW